MMFGERIRSRALTVGVACLAAVIGAGLTTTAKAQSGFRQWIANFESVAARNGVDRNVYRAAFEGVTSADKEVIEKANYQPEFQSKVWDYLDNRVNAEQIRKGRDHRNRMADTLAGIEQRFGVDRDILLAIWSIETNYGAVLKRDDIMRSLPRSLATLAYYDDRRASFARNQLIAALKIAQAGHIKTDELISSWAGAMGHTQFIPTSYQAYMADFDGDGHANVWESVPDALATAANLLSRNGWRTGKTWGYEVIVPDRYRSKLERDNRTLGEWASMGFERPSGNGFAHPGDRANLVRPAGDNGPAFLMTRNFFVLKKYNNADKYALAVGLLADRIAGYEGLYQSWPRGYEPLTSDQRYELQRALAARGLYDGKIDGKIGSGSKSAIMSLQREAGMSPTGNASQEILTYIRRN